MEPPTSVRTARPVRARPAKGVFRLFEKNVVGSTVQRAVISSTTTSAAAPGWSEPPGSRSTADQLDRAARRHMTQVDVTPGEPGEQDVTPHHDLLRRSRNALQPEAGRNEAFVHHATRGEGRLLAMVRDRNPEAPGVLERGAHHVARDDGLPVVRYRDGAGADQLAELGELLAVLAHRNRPDRVDPREPGADRLTYDEADRGLVVRHGIGVRHPTH